MTLTLRWNYFVIYCYQSKKKKLWNSHKWFILLWIWHSYNTRLRKLTPGQSTSCFIPRTPRTLGLDRHQHKIRPLYCKVYLSVWEKTAAFFDFEVQQWQRTFRDYKQTKKVYRCHTRLTLSWISLKKGTENYCKQQQ